MLPVLFEVDPRPEVKECPKCGDATHLLTGETTRSPRECQHKWHRRPWT